MTISSWDNFRSQRELTSSSVLQISNWHFIYQDIKLNTSTNFASLISSTLILKQELTNLRMTKLDKPFNFTLIIFLTNKLSQRFLNLMVNKYMNEHTDKPRSHKALPWMQPSEQGSGGCVRSFTWNEKRNRVQVTYKVLEARFVSSCFNCPSRAKPHLSLLLARRGVITNTLLKVKPGPMGHPSLGREKNRDFKLRTTKGVAPSRPEKQEQVGRLIRAG